jgi:molecular chaperone Hsp31 and glyoxalase 3
MGLCTSQLTGENLYAPSKFTQTMFMPSVTEFEKNYNGRSADSPAYKGGKKILVVMNEERALLMKNGKNFDTGNHPIETLVPLLYLRDAGFTFEFATPTGKPAHFEMWAFPKKDVNVKEIYDALKPAMDAPTALPAVDEKLSNYSAIFVPGGHGAMHLATNASLGALLRSANSQELTTLSLCHGPAGFLSSDIGGEFPYKGYQINVFPDSVDDFTPTVGYMPGKMELPVCAALIAKGFEIMNTKDDDSTFTYKEVITGASPKASNNLGKVASDALVKKLC